MNINSKGPLYPDDRPFYYDPEIPKDTGIGNVEQDERKSTISKVLIFLILTFFLLFWFLF